MLPARSGWTEESVIPARIYIFNMGIIKGAQTMPPWQQTLNSSRQLKSFERCMATLATAFVYLRPLTAVSLQPVLSKCQPLLNGDDLFRKRNNTITK